MINPDWDRSKKNYDSGFRLLILAGIVTIVVSLILKVQPVKNITLGIAITFFFAGLVHYIMFKVRPGAFKDKSSNPDKES